MEIAGFITRSILGLDMNDAGRWDGFFFGVGGVLLDSSSIRRAHRRFIENLVEEFVPEIELETAIDQWQSGVNEYIRSVGATEHQSARDAYASGVSELVDDPIDPGDWWPMYEDAIQAQAEPMPRVHETLQEFDESPLHLGVISNLDANEVERYLGLLDIRSFFDSITTAEQVNNAKPHPAIFRRAIQTAGVNPSSSLMVGDHYEEDMRGAKNIEMYTAAIGRIPATRNQKDPFIDYVLDNINDLLAIRNESVQPD